MAEKTQTEKDTERAKSRQGGGQAAKDTEKAKSRQGGGQAAKDTERAKSRQGGGQTEKDTERAKARTDKDTAAAKSKQQPSGGTPSSMDSRERNAGLNLAGNDTTSGRAAPEQTFREREQAAGLHNSTLGRDGAAMDNDSFYDFGEAAGGVAAATHTEVYTSKNDMGWAQKEPEVVIVHPYKISIKSDPDGIAVLGGAVSNKVVEYFEDSGSPEEVWLELTLNNDREITAQQITTDEPTESATVAALLIGTIDWSDDNPVISQYVKNSLGYFPCGNVFYVNG